MSEDQTRYLVSDEAFFRENLTAAADVLYTAVDGVREHRDEMVAHLIRQYVSALAITLKLQGKEDVLMRQVGELLRRVREIDDRLSSSRVGSGRSDFPFREVE